ncbi:TPA: hypothetical protein ACKP9S_005703 [Pseudomonas aeruginosa]
MTWPTTSVERAVIPPAMPGTRLLKPVPDDCSDRYAAGWAFADGVIASGGDLNAEAPHEWHEEKTQGYVDRLQAG